MAPTGDGGVRRCGFFAEAGFDFSFVVVGVVPTGVVFAGDFLAAVHVVEFGDAKGLGLGGVISVGDSGKAIGSVITPRGGEAGGAAGFEGEGFEGIGIREVGVIGGFRAGGDLMQSGVGQGVGVFGQM